jgi:three-Cys-motif partner protein
VEHTLRARILSSTEVYFYFFEVNEHNYTQLCRELQAFGQLPKNVFVNPRHGDYEAHLREAIADLRSKGRRMAPAFAFIDPYGFTISMDLLNQLLDFPACELLINFMYRYIDMAIHQPVQAANMDSLFGCHDWQGLTAIKDPPTRANETIALFSGQLSAKYVTHMNMIGDNNVLKYALIHATNHERGREVMKQAIWSVTPDGTFSAYERNTPDQLVLIVPEPDLKPLKYSLHSAFAGQKVQMTDVDRWLLSQLYLPKHLHQVLRELRDDGVVQFGGHEGKFAFSKNPTVSFSQSLGK